MRVVKGLVKPGIWLAAACLAVLAAFLFPVCGCGGEEKGVKVERSEEGGTGGVVELEDGRLETAEFEPTEESLGLPIYPGARLVPGSGLTMRRTQGEKVLVSNQAEFLTGDALGKVVDWYRGKLDQPARSEPGEATWIFREEGVIRSLIAEETGEGTLLKYGVIVGDLELGGESP